MEFTVGKHPDAKLKSQVFKWAVFRNGELFEGFVYKEDAETAAAEYNSENKK
jgi:hypothetical protein